MRGSLNSLIATGVSGMYKDLIGTYITAEEIHVVWLICSLYVVSVCLSVFAALKYRDWRIVAGYYSVITLVVAGVGIVAGVVALVSAVLLVVVVVGAVAGAIVVVGEVAVSGKGMVAAVVVAVVSVSVSVSRMGVEAEAEAQMVVGSVMTFIYSLLGWYLNRRSLKSEDPMLALLRRYALAWRCWGGTQFSGATLTHTDLTEADLTAVRFANAKFRQPDFTGAKNLHLTWAYATPLERKPVRTLMTEGRIDDLDFSNLNLRGLSFKDLNLTGRNFYHADLSDADFSGCDLSEADLTEAMVLGARFSHAKLTGAIIENWSMDKQTQFDDVECEFVFTKRNKEERNPPDGTFFKPGEFSKLYQEIANTVDFIAHSPDELQALLRAIDHIKQQGGDIVIQSLERKNESVVVRTQSSDAIDKAAIYAEVKEQMAEEMILLQQEKQLLLQKVEMQEQQTDTLKQFLKLAIESPKIMQDNSRHYENISAQNAAVNLGDASTVSNHIEQVADVELKAALQALQQLLAGSHLPAIDKQEAHKAVDDLAAISQKPQAERKSLARRSLAFLKDLQQDLSSVAELGEQYGKLLVKVMAWF